MNLGFPEMLFIFLLALIIFGPKKLPEIGRQIGKALAEFKRASNEFKYQLETEMRQLDSETTQSGSAGAGQSEGLAGGIGRAVAEFQRVTTEVRSRFEGGLRQLEEETTPSPAPATISGSAVASPTTPAPVPEPVQAEAPPAEVKGADA